VADPWKPSARRQRLLPSHFHEKLVTDILDRARAYENRPRRRVLDLVTKTKRGPKSKGTAIREKIAANAARRIEIAEAMKREAGVVGHELIGQNDGGLAWTDRAHILAPVGQNRVQLATLAHECGHVFLHGRGGYGYHLPGHVKEMEAESYAHQAFDAHGMKMPKQITDWGRRYVGRWVAEDRAAGIAIDPRAVAYATGRRSPFEPLRMTPDAWQQLEVEPPVVPVLDDEHSIWRRMAEWLWRGVVVILGRGR
jgi:hypothetical protein